jgi:Spy/CpxP family protein refolding chaperone
MKAYLLQLPVLIAALFLGNNVSAQADLAPDQNPNFAVSRAKYMGMADSINTWHSTTIQDTYKAKDWLADKAEARMERRQFRRELRRYRAGWDEPYYNSYYNNYNYRYYPNNGYRSRYYRNNYYNNYHRGHRNFWWGPWWW